MDLSPYSIGGADVTVSVPRDSAGQKRELPASWWDWVPVVGSFRQFVWHKKEGNFGRALGYFVLTAADGASLGGSTIIKNGIKKGGQAAAEKIFVREVVEEADVKAAKVLVDSNVVPGMKADPTAGGRILAGEQPVVSNVAAPELRNAVANGNLRGVPGNLNSFEVLNDVPSLNLRINVRGMLPAGRGRFGDGIIGAQALETGLPLVTNDKALANTVRALGGTVRP
jgi:predicted nucleic acid-binding protein